MLENRKIVFTKSNFPRKKRSLNESSNHNSPIHCLLRGAVIYLKMIISKKRNRRRAKNLVIFYNFNGPPNAVSYSLFLSLSPFHTHQTQWKTLPLSLLLLMTMIFHINPLFCLCCWRWWLSMLSRCWSTYTESYAVSEEDVVWVQEREKNIFTNELVLVCSVGWMKTEKQIFYFSKKHSITPLPACLSFLCAAFTVVLLFVLRLPKMADCQG